MTPIEQVTPALPGNTVRRPEARNKRNVAEPGRDRKQKEDHRRGPGQDQRPGGSEHIVDEFA